LGSAESCGASSNGTPTKQRCGPISLLPVAATIFAAAWTAGIDATRSPVLSATAAATTATARPTRILRIYSRREYFDWAKQVVDRIRGTHARLEALFDAAYAARP
jgi:hypothetical protein